MIRPPNNTHASAEDFRSSGWEQVVSASMDSGYFSRWNGLVVAAAAACQANEFRKAKILWLLGDACSLRFESNNINEPFGPTNRRIGEQFFSLADYGEEDLGVLDSFYAEIDDVFLRARIADILWLRFRKHEYALAAIDAYRSTSLDKEAWFQQGIKDCWCRAIVLSIQLKKTAEMRLTDIETRLLSAIHFDLSSGGNAFPSMAKVLIQYGLAEEHLFDLGEQFVARASSVLSSLAENRFFHARSILFVAKLCFKQNQEKLADVACLISKVFEEEAKSLLNSKNPSYVLAANLYTDAIGALKDISRTLRATKGIDDRLSSLHQVQRDLATRSIGDFVPTRSDPVDIEKECQKSRDCVAGKDVLEALLVLAECHQPIPFGLLEESTRRAITKDPFGLTFSTIKLASDGRVVARNPVVKNFPRESEDLRKTILNKMVQDHSVYIRFAVSATIFPTLSQILLEHFICRDDLSNIVAQSGIVLSDRVLLVAKGLQAGFDGDFVVALHLLVPQLEHIVRTLLQNKGVKTTTPTNGLQMEAGLSALAEKPEFEEIFGGDLSFQIRAVFCDGFGPNLRNEIAHGLMDQDGLQSAECIYAWWLIFSVIYRQYWYRDV